MAKKITTTRIVSDEEERLRDAEAELDSDYSETSASAFLSKFKGSQGCQIKIYRQTERGRQYCLTESPENVDEEYLRQYHSRQTFGGTEGLYYIVVEVNGERREPFPIRIAPQHVDNAPNMSGLPGTEYSGIAFLAQQLREQNARIERILENSIQRTPPMLEMVQAIQALDAMRGQNQNILTPDAILKWIDVGKSISGVPDEGWSGIAKDVIKDAAPIIAPMLSRFIPSGAPQAAPAAPQAAAALPQASPDAAVKDNMPPEAQEIAILKTAITFLKTKSAKHSDPGLYCDLIMDNREDPLYARLIHQIITTDFSAFVALDPEIGVEPHRSFFEFIYNGIRSIFVEDGSMAQHQPGKNGNAPNAAGDGKAGKSGGKRPGI